MCIRDRDDDVVAHADAAVLAAVAEEAGVLGDDAHGGCPRPVSYTHLRAHEAVLDLVCRLLLEKKKHYRQSQCSSRSMNTNNDPHLHDLRIT